jgi:hypothetical protein
MLTFLLYMELSPHIPVNCECNWMGTPKAVTI